MNSSLQKSEERSGLLFVLPQIIGLILFILLPLIIAIYLCFCEWDFISSPEWVGLANFKAVFGFDGDIFAKTLENTGVFLLGVIPLTMFLALGLALLANQHLPFLEFYKSALFMPMVTSSVAIAMVWYWLFAPDIGLINFMIEQFQIDGPGWLSDPKWARVAIIIMTAWLKTGYYFIVYTLTSSSLLESAISSTELMNTHKADTFDLFVEELEITLKDLTDSEATKAFLQLKGEPESDSYYLSVVRLGEKLDTLITQRGEAVSAVAFLWNDGSLPVVRSNGHPFSLLGDYRLYSPYKEMLQADAAVHWIVLQTRFSDQSDLFLYKTIYDVLTEKNLGLALIRIDDSYIESILQTGNRTKDRTMLFTETGELVFSVGRLDEGVVAADLIQEYAMYGTQSHKMISGKNGDFLLTRAASYEMGYKIINVTPLSDIANTSEQVMCSIIISVLAVLAIAIAMSLILFRYLKAPIIGVHSAMANFRRGKLDERIDVKRTDELGQLGIGFNEMAEQINLLIVKNEQEQRKKQEISMRFLQAQISPHFLYNTLNSIKALSRMNRNAEACEMITSLISLLRLASGGNEEISLSQEIRYVESYVMLMCKRKDIKVDLTVDLPENLQLCKVLKFTLQPFVENSIIHGITDSVIQIHIRASQILDQVLEIHISDNGQGFDTSVLRVKCNTNEQNRFSRIGINNVAERIKLYYGDSFGVDIVSAVNRGTEITIKLPLAKMPEDETGESSCKI